MSDDIKYSFQHQNHKVLILDNGLCYEASINGKPLLSKHRSARVLVTADMPEKMKKKAIKAINENRI